MAEVTRRRLGELLRELFEILLRTPDGMQARDALAALAAKGKLTAYEAGDYESGGRRFEEIVRFATVDTVKAGWLAKAKGRWSVTEQGRLAVGKYADPEAFYREAVKLYRKWKASRPESEPESDAEPTDKTSAKATSITYEEAEEQAWAEVEA